jgi:hypothetical protein
MIIFSCCCISSSCLLFLDGENTLCLLDGITGKILIRGESYTRDDAFLLAYRPQDETLADEWFKANIDSLTEKERQIAHEYRAYLQAQSKRLAEAASGHYLIAGLFVSCKRGAGAPLMQMLLEQCEKEGYESLYLWADSACNYSYYEKRGFEKVGFHRDCEFVDGQKFDIYVFRKTF